MKKSSLTLILAAVLTAALVSCSLGGREEATPDASAPTPTLETSGEAVAGTAMVDSVEILVLESFPVLVNVIVSGNLPDGCTRLETETVERTDNSFVISLPTIRPADAVCTEALVPFDKVISLDVEGLEAGTYTVTVNGVSETFTLDVDNVPVAEPTEQVGAPPAGGGAISGRVWHDLCAVAGGEGGEPAVPSAGCVALTGGGFEANGVFEPEEPGIEGVEVALTQGACGAEPTATVTTNADGFYSFTGLEPGNYCISIDPLTEPNTSLLIPGGWTFPPSDGLVEAEVSVTAGQVTPEINFGWDHQFLPEPDDVVAAVTPSPGPRDCTDAADFVADLTIPDDTVVPAGTTFTKTWRLINTGTCTWNTGYALVFAGGDQMGGPDSVPLSIQVPTGSTIDLTVVLQAPATNGTYRGEYQLRNDQGVLFGIPEPDVVFWVQIAVIDGEEGGGDDEGALPSSRVLVHWAGARRV